MKRTRETFVHLIAKSCCVSALTLGTLCLPTLTHAQTSVATVPQGYVTLTVSAGTGSSYIPTVISLPLLATSNATGQTTGIITSLTSTTINNSNAGWVAGALSNATSPYLIRITSGAAKGRTFLLSTATANTTTAVTVDALEGVNLSNLSIVAGTDTYELIPCDTLLSIFGTPATTGIWGNATATHADQIMVLINGAWSKFYYNTGSSDWRAVGTDAAGNNIPIPPHTAVIYNRWPNTPLTFTITGRVPDAQRAVSVANSGLSLLSSGWPTSVTLTNSGIHQISGWTSNANAANADQVQMMIEGGWRKYYHDGTAWRQVGTDEASNTTSIPIGSGALIIKKGSVTGNTTLTQIPPYNLN